MQEKEGAHGPSLGGENSLEEGRAIHSSIFAWRIPWTEDPGGLQSIGSQRVYLYCNNLAWTEATQHTRMPLLIGSWDGCSKCVPAAGALNIAKVVEHRL